jgi:CubicO group peptidase (beta-lactamase class C family)
MAGGDVESVVAQVLHDRHCPGAVVTISTEGHDQTFAVGATTVDTATPTNASTSFEIGSITKVLVATLVLQHVARGDIGLDDPVSAHLPEFRLADADATALVTIRHLLIHSSGIDIADDFTDTGSGDDCVRRYVEQAVTGAGLLHPVGVRWSYCNGGYIVLGRLIEVLDGRPWDVALEQRILRPCGMDAAPRRLVSGDRVVAVGHRVDPITGAVTRTEQQMPSSVGPAGNVVATTEALVRFTERLFDASEPLLPAALVADMLVPQIAAREMNQGLGWAIATTPILVASHGGATIGATAFLGAIPSLKSTLAVVVNGPAAGAIALAVYEHLSGMQITPPAAPRVTATDDELRRVAGRYVRRHVVQDIELVGGRLVAHTRFVGPVAELLPQPPSAELEPIGGLTFVSTHPFEPEPARFDFDTPDDTGAPTRLFTQRLHARVPTA